MVIIVYGKWLPDHKATSMKAKKQVFSRLFEGPLFCEVHRSSISDSYVASREPILLGYGKTITAPLAVHAHTGNNIVYTITQQCTMKT